MLLYLTLKKLSSTQLWLYFTLRKLFTTKTHVLFCLNKTFITKIFVLFQLKKSFTTEIVALFHLKKTFFYTNWPFISPQEDFPSHKLMFYSIWRRLSPSKFWLYVTLRRLCTTQIVGLFYVKKTMHHTNYDFISL